MMDLFDYDSDMHRTFRKPRQDSAVPICGCRAIVVIAKKKRWEQKQINW